MISPYLLSTVVCSALILMRAHMFECSETNNEYFVFTNSSRSPPRWIQRLQSKNLTWGGTNFFPSRTQVLTSKYNRKYFETAISYNSRQDTIRKEADNYLNHTYIDWRIFGRDPSEKPAPDNTGNRSDSSRRLDPSPCSNGGTGFVVHNKVRCICRSGYNGTHCDIRYNVCEEFLWPNNRLPCYGNRMRGVCRPVLGGGFACQGQVDSSRSKHRTRVYCDGEDVCPRGWDCLDLYLTQSTGGYHCDPPDKDLATSVSTQVSRKKRSADNCAENLCQNGAQCYNQTCRCLAHYTGRYCELRGDYCYSNPCPKGVECEPILGGYTCLCPPTHMGTHCDIRRRLAVKQIHGAGLMYHPKLFVDVSSTFCFYAASLGVIPYVVINLGGEPIRLKKEHFIFKNKSDEFLLKFFSPPLGIPSNRLYIYLFQHVYKQTGTKRISIFVSNRGYKTFESNYALLVEETPKCTVTTTLKHCASPNAHPITYQRKHRIVIMSGTRVDCPQAVLQRTWKIYNVRLNEDGEEVTVEFYPGGKFDVSGPHLTIPPFTLPLGKYYVYHKVRMLFPVFGPEDIWRTRLQIKRAPLRAILDGGTVINARRSKSFTLDASKSYDPNLPVNEQTPIKFTWYCYLYQSHPKRKKKSEFCNINGNKPLNSTDSKLVVPANVLDRQSTYEFRLKISKNKGDEVENRGATSQFVTVVSDSTPLIRLKCWSNCDEVRSNPSEVTSLEAVCISCNDTLELEDLSWNVDKGVGVRSTEFGFDNPLLMIYEKALVDGNRYTMVFKSVADTEISAKGSLREEYFGTAEYVLRTNEAPSRGYCYPTPKRGYAMLTNFGVHCKDFQDRDKPLSYEIAQFTDTEAEGGVLVGYEMGPEINDLTLLPGKAKHDFVTTLRVFVSDGLGLSAHYDYNVTVYPVFYYVKDVSEMIYHFKSVVHGDESRLGLLSLAKNTRNVVSLAMSTASSLYEFSYGENSKRLNQTQLKNDIVKMRHMLVDYLYKEPIVTVSGCKHFATSLDIILRGSGIQLDSTCNRLGGEMLGRITEFLKKYKEDNIQIHRIDMHDLGIAMLSLSSVLFPIPSDLPDITVYRRSISKVESEEFFETLEVRHLLVEKEYSGLMNKVLRDIDIFANILLDMKAFEEHSSLVNGSGVTLIVKKGSRENFQKENINMDEIVVLTPVFNNSDSRKRLQLRFYVLVVNHNPFWWHASAKDVNFPVLFSDMRLEDGGVMNVPMEVDFRILNKPKPDKIQGSLRIQPHWEIKEEDVQVHRAKLPKGGKLMIHFTPLARNIKLQVVVKTNFRPELYDFHKDAIVIPHQAPGTSTEEMYSLHVNDAAIEDDTIYYIAVLIHVDTINYLLGSVREEPHLPSIATYEDDYNTNSERVPQVAELRETQPNTSLTYELSAYSVRCLTLETRHGKWGTESCELSASSTPATVVCRCVDLSPPLTVSYMRAPVDRSNVEHLWFYITFLDNQLILFLIILLTALFLGLLVWGRHKDVEDREGRNVMFLSDSNPLHEYFYILIVHTGRRPRAGTSSHVAVLLEGEEGSSQTHVLTDGHHRMLRTASQDWFVLKTAACLGDIHWLHVWHDHSGSSPHWYCDRIIVHDIQNNQVWFFLVKRWLSPLHGDGSMSCSVFKTVESGVFARRFRFNDIFWDQFDNGHFGWLSVFHKHPYSNFTRCQRICTSFTHVAILLMIVTELHEVPVHDEPVFQIDQHGGHGFHWSDVVRGVIVALIAYPIYCILATVFMCTNPVSKWSSSPTNYQGSISIQLESEEDTRSDSSMARKISQSEIKQNLKRPAGSMSRPTLTTIFESEEQPFMTRLTGFFFKSPNKTRERRDWFKRNTKHAGIGVPSSPVEMKPDENRVPSQRGSNTLEDPETKINFSGGKHQYFFDSKPMFGTKCVERKYCFPYWFLYIAWFLLVAIFVPCIFFVVLFGVSYSWPMSLRFLCVSLVSLLFNVAVLDTLKMLLIVCYCIVRMQKEFLIEDRSEIVRFLNDKFKPDKGSHPRILKELFLLRKGPIYQPLPKERVNLLYRNAKVAATIRVFVSDLGLFFLLAVILLCIINGIRDSRAFYNSINIKTQLVGKPDYGIITLEEVASYEDFVHYLKLVALPVIHNSQWYNNDTTPTTGQLQDMVNTLIGVPRLRQIRADPNDCIATEYKGEILGINCFRELTFVKGDTKNYGPSWGPYVPSLENETFQALESWKYKSLWELDLWLSKGYVSSYYWGGYVAELGRGLEPSKVVLDYLVYNRWFDNMTLSVYFEFTLYNPNRDLVSLVSVLAERGATGGFITNNVVHGVKVRPLDSTEELFVTVVLIVFIFVLAIFIRRERRKFALLQTKRYFNNVWNILMISFVTMGVAICVLYCLRVMHARSNAIKIAMADVESFVSFYTFIYYDTIILTLAAIMMFFVFLKLWRLLSTGLRLPTASTVPRIVSATFIGCSVMFGVALTSFSALGYLCFVSYSYQFRNIRSSFTSTLGLSVRIFKYKNIVRYPFLGVDWLGGFFFVVAFFMLVLIFRWVFAIIVMKEYSEVMALESRGHDEPRESSLLDVRSSSSRRFQRGSNTGTVDIIERAASSLSVSDIREKTMRCIVECVLSGRDVSFVSEEVRSIAMACRVVTMQGTHLRKYFRRDIKRYNLSSLLDSRRRETDMYRLVRNAVLFKQLENKMGLVLKKINSLVKL